MLLVATVWIPSSASRYGTRGRGPWIASPGPMDGTLVAAPWTLLQASRYGTRGQGPWLAYPGTMDAPPPTDLGSHVMDAFPGFLFRDPGEGSMDGQPRSYGRSNPRVN